jgi:mRNA-degrading endonuclease RelE of RelBE toxin-antitoxin system
MDDVSKFLKKLTPAERKRITTLITKIIAGNLSDLDIKRLREHDGIFRARSGHIRIIYSITEKGVKILQVGFRSEDTYKK